MPPGWKPGHEPRHQLEHQIGGGRHGGRHETRIVQHTVDKLTSAPGNIRRPQHRVRIASAALAEHLIHQRTLSGGRLGVFP
jgi:hypothetical protein